MIKILFPAFFLMVSSCGMITAKEIHGRQLLRPLMVQTTPPPLSYHGSAAGFDYFSTLFCKYKVPQTEEIMLEQYRRPFLSWRGGGEKQKPGLSINKQGKWTVMLFPAAAPPAVPLKDGHTEKSRLPALLKGGGRFFRRQKAGSPP